MYESDHGESQWGDSVLKWPSFGAFGQPCAWATVASLSLVCHVSSLLQLPVESWCHKVPRYIPQGMASPASLHHRCGWKTSEGGCVQSWFSTCTSALRTAALRHKEGISPNCSHKLPLRGFRGCLWVISVGVPALFLLALAVKMIAFLLRRFPSSSSLASMALHSSLICSFSASWQSNFVILVHVSPWLWNRLIPEDSLVHFLISLWIYDNSIDFFFHLSKLRKRVKGPLLFSRSLTKYAHNHPPPTHHDWTRSLFHCMCASQPPWSRFTSYCSQWIPVATVKGTWNQFLCWSLFGPMCSSTRDKEEQNLELSPPGAMRPFNVLTVKALMFSHLVFWFHALV